MAAVRKRFLFVINHVSGRKTLDWETVILEHFKDYEHDLEFYELPEKFTADTVRDKIKTHKPDYVVAVGGDGTINLLASCVMNTPMKLGILPAGSANGMAKELNISDQPAEAMDTIVKGFTRSISLISINEHISMHLSDIGLNAYMLREFERRGVRGFWGYMMATIKVLSKRKALRVNLHFDGKNVKVRADIIIIANATRYGTGVLVNPVGKLDDNVFEIIAVNDLSVKDLLKTSLHTLRLDENKAEIFQTSELHLTSDKPVHFQVDGEYLGKVKEIKAKLMRGCVTVVVPESSVQT